MISTRQRRENVYGNSNRHWLGCRCLFVSNMKRVSSSLGRLVKVSIIAWLTLFPHVARTEPRLDIISVDGLFAVSDEQVQTIYADAARYFAQVGITFRVKYLAVDYNPCIYKHSLVSRESELKCFEVFTTRRSKVITYIMTPPFVTVDEAYGPQTAWIAGIAKLCGNLATGNAEEKSLSKGVIGDSRLMESATVMAHEILHTMCATHNNSAPNIMHPEANRFTQQYSGNLPVLEFTKRQVKRWYVKRRKANGTEQ